jgi:hypothetical protein
MIKKGRGRPKGMLNATVKVYQSTSRSPMKLRSTNSSHPSKLSDSIPEGSIPEDVEGGVICCSDVNINIIYFFYLIRSKRFCSSSSITEFSAEHDIFGLRVSSSDLFS